MDGLLPKDAIRSFFLFISIIKSVITNKNREFLESIASERFYEVLQKIPRFKMAPFLYKSCGYNWLIL